MSNMFDYFCGVPHTENYLLFTADEYNTQNINVVFEINTFKIGNYI